MQMSVPYILSLFSILNNLYMIYEYICAIYKQFHAFGHHMVIYW